jgi:hypothetical protein
LQRADDGGTLVFSTGAQQLQDEEVTKAIDGHARQTVGFTGDQTIAVKAIASRQPFAPGLRLLQATLEKGVIDSFIAIEAPDASADLRRGRIRAAGQPFPCESTISMVSPERALPSIRATAPEKIHGWRRSRDFSRPLVNTKRGKWNLSWSYL